MNTIHIVRSYDDGFPSLKLPIWVKQSDWLTDWNGLTEFRITDRLYRVLTEDVSSISLLGCLNEIDGTSSVNTTTVWFLNFWIKKNSQNVAQGRQTDEYWAYVLESICRNSYLIIHLITILKAFVLWPFPSILLPQIYQITPHSCQLICIIFCLKHNLISLTMSSGSPFSICMQLIANRLQAEELA